MDNLTIQWHNCNYQIHPFQFDWIWKSIQAGQWEKESFTIFQHFITKTDNLLDIGA